MVKERQFRKGLRSSDPTRICGLLRGIGHLTNRIADEQTLSQRPYGLRRHHQWDLSPALENEFQPKKKERRVTGV